jgi:formiminotetrahydrofolate cyclodeaminase
VSESAPGGRRDASLEELLERFASRDPLPAGGAATALVAATAAGVVAMAAARRDQTDRADRAHALRRRAIDLIAEDVDAYSRVVDGAIDPQEATAPPLEIAEVAADVADLAAELHSVVSGPLRGDVHVAAELAATAASCAARLAQLNLRDHPDDERHSRAAEAAARARMALRLIEDTTP